jgi:chromosome partitioning protein
VIVVTAALKGGVGKTTTAVYLAAVAASSRRTVVLVEAPTDRLLAKALDRVGDEQVAIVDTPPGQERLLAKALARATVAVIPTRVGGVETPRVNAVLELMPAGVPAGLVISSARTFTRDYQDAVAAWAEAGVPVWGSAPERVAIAAGPSGWLSPDGLDAYRNVWHRVLRAAIVKPGAKARRPK